MWRYLETRHGLPGNWKDVLFHHCRFGSAWKKPTILRCWGPWWPKALNKICLRREGVLSCGNDQHTELGFGGASTAAAAAYPARWCAEYAAALVKWQMSISAKDRVILTGSGKVKRHVDRGHNWFPTDGHRALRFVVATFRRRLVFGVWS